LLKPAHSAPLPSQPNGLPVRIRARPRVFGCRNRRSCWTPNAESVRVARLELTVSAVAGTDCWAFLAWCVLQSCHPSIRLRSESCFHPQLLRVGIETLEKAGI
jgi:hypothetical protein